MQGASKLRPQDLAEWQAFEEQLQHPPDIQQAWRAHTSRLVTQLQRLQRREQLEAAAQGYDDAADEQQYEYDDECEDGDDEQQHPTRGPDSDYGQDEELQGQQGSQAHENLSSYRAGTGSAAAAAGRFSGLGRSRQQQHSDELQQSAGKGSPCADAQQQPYPEQLGRVKRRQRRCDEDASDSQEAAACSYQESEETGLSNGSRHAHAAPGDGGLGTAGDHFLHLLAVGEAMIKTEGVAPEDRKEAWEQVSCIYSWLLAAAASCCMLQAITSGVVLFISDRAQVQVAQKTLNLLQPLSLCILPVACTRGGQTHQLHHVICSMLRSVCQLSSTITKPGQLTPSTLLSDHVLKLRQKSDRYAVHLHNNANSKLSTVDSGP